jgi:hypothetical protein
MNTDWMNTDARRPSPSPSPSPTVARHRAVVAVKGFMAMPVLIAGVLCLLDESSRLEAPPVLTQCVFSALLCGWLGAEWYTLRRKFHVAVADDRNFTRELTRRMYLMLYAIVGVSQLIGLFSLHDGGTFHHPDGSFLGIALMGLALARAPRFLTAKRGR